MWAGHIGALVDYGMDCCIEWTTRGYKDTCYDKLFEIYYMSPTNNKPSFIGNEAFHASHRAALLFKNPDWYGQFGWTEKPELNYIWSVT
jgi:hypothetical protein